MPASPNETADDIDDLEDDFEDHYEAAKGALDDYVANNPIAAIAISLGLGIFIGRFIL